MTWGAVPRVAIIGSGISGLGLARRLAGLAQLTLFEANDYFGGHTRTVDVTLPGPEGPVTHGVDTGFLVFNHHTYPQLVRLFEQLGVETSACDMSFSVQVADAGLEWSGSSLDTVFAQRRNLLRPRFWRMLGDIARFNRLATSFAERDPEGELDASLGAFLDRHGFGADFREWYFMPMVGSIWSSPQGRMLDFPTATMIRFCDNHGLLRWSGRPQWYTVPGGARQYVQRIVRRLGDARLCTPVRRVTRASRAGVLVDTDAGREPFDDVVFACHSDQALALLGDPTPAERRLLGSIRYHGNLAVLHTDARLMPRRRKAWAAWNHESTGASADSGTCVHYWLNRLQPLPFRQELFLTLNPVRQPRPDSVIDEFEYSHPLFDGPAIAAQRELASLQGRQHTWYCGAWTGHGFHEDGLQSALHVADSLLARSRACELEPA